jgi:hypothetical protein
MFVPTSRLLIWIVRAPAFWVSRRGRSKDGERLGRLGEDTGDLVFDRAVPSSKWKLNGRLGLQREGNGWQPRASGQRGRRIRRSTARSPDSPLISATLRLALQSAATQSHRLAHEIAGNITCRLYEYTQDSKSGLHQSSE